MNPKPPKGVYLVSVVLLLTMLACSLGSATPTNAPQTAVPVITEEQPTEKSGNAVGSLDDVQSATIQIIAEGTFAEPEGLAVNAFGAGSGFIIDPSGIAVTNNHVVTGAALLKVYIGGDTSKSYNAKVLGASECSDLAIIDIQGDGFPYLEWYPSNASVGLDVYAAGYPLGDPEFTLTRGIVSKAQTDGESDWASVDNVLEHDATINPGNSGGPLVSGDGQVVGINYAYSTVGRNQYYAIGRAEADAVIEELQAGKDVTSIGINGRAFISDDGSLSGIWVSSVKSGSPADKAGLKPADIVLQMEGLVLSLDGTMSDYCDILRSHNMTDTLSVTVFRTGTGSMMEGQINGRALEETFQVARDQGTETFGNDSSTYSTYETVNDDQNVLKIDVPVEWSDRITGSWRFGDRIVGPIVKAAGNIDNWNAGWTESGVFFGASTILSAEYTADSYLNSDNFSNDCTFDSRNDYTDAVFVGKYDLYKNCGGGDTLFVNLAVTTDRFAPEIPTVFVLVQVIITKNADFDALDRILASFDIINATGFSNWTGSSTDDTNPPPSNPPSSNATLDEKIQNARILVYEDTIYEGLWVQSALDQAGIPYVTVKDLVGHFMENLTDGSYWDLIIVAAEGKSVVSGEFWPIIEEHLDNNTALIAEMWTLDMFHNGKIKGVLQRCGVDYQKNWDLAEPLYWLAPDHALLHTPNEGFSLVNYNRYWTSQAGDLMELTPGSDATMIAGTIKNQKTSYGTVATCVGGRVVLQTFSNHDYHKEDVVALWQNYVYWVLSNHFAVMP